MRSGKCGMRLQAGSGEERMTLAARCMVAGLMALIFVMSAASLAIADVDTAGRLRTIPSTSKSPGEVEPLFEKASGDYECYSYSDVQNAADSYVIGNCDAPWQIQVVSYSGPNGEGYHSYGGFITGAFSGCGWIETRFEPKKLNSNKNSACGEGSTGDFEVPQSSFMERHNSAAGDGWPVVTTQACPEYANYRPWSSNNVEQELIRTAPAYASSGRGSNYPALKWRYISKYESTDGTHRYVMVRDDRYNAGEGNWVFVPRSCLPSTLPENENERLPPPPTVTTDGASEVATSSATLNATINPNGVDTQYFFEYGTTESYGSYTSAEDAGAGTSPAQVSAAIGGLAANTTYYFRIVASSATGEVFGGPVPFTTQALPPAVSTGGHSGLQPLQATLEGTVNPNGVDTHYYFQYGTTTEYGSTTTSTDVGSGTTSVPVNVAVVGLDEGVTYHYRVVANNSGGTAYGSDQSFTTQEAEKSSGWVTRNPLTTEQWVFYRGSTGNVNLWAWSGTKWVLGELSGHAIAANSSPTVVRNQSDGEQWVFFQGSNGNIDLSSWNGKEWVFGELGGHGAKAGTSPTVVRDPNTGEQWVYYQGSNGNIDLWYWSGKEWSWGERGGHAASAGTSPTVVRNEGSGEQWVYYQGSNENIDLWYWSGKEWSWGERGGHAASAGTSPTVVRNEGSGEQWVYYRGSNGNVDLWTWSGKEWVFGEFGSHAAKAGTSPTVVQNESNGEQWVYYQGGNGSIDLWAWNGKEWLWGERGGYTAATSASPTAIRDPNSGEQWVYFAGSNGAMDLWGWNNTTWQFKEL